MSATPPSQEALSRPTLLPGAVVYSWALLENKVWLAGQCASFALFVCNDSLSAVTSQTKVHSS